MMNKYQEALEFLRSEDVTAWGNDKLEILYFHLDNIEELVEKATPKKPNYEADGYDENGELIYDTWICPNCDKKYEVDYDEYDHCPNCGQVIDWSDEEWK